MDKKGRGVTDKVVSVTQLRKLINFDEEELGIVVWLRRRGYVKYPKRINYEKENHWVWYRGISESKVNKAFRESMNEKYKG